jgi:hypothetical protein
MFRHRRSLGWIAAELETFAAQLAPPPAVRADAIGKISS